MIYLFVPQPVLHLMGLLYWIKGQGLPFFLDLQQHLTQMLCWLEQI